MVMIMSTTAAMTEGDEAMEAEVTKIRISLILSPSYYHNNNRDILQLPNEPIAVPATIRKRGLSAVVNHLLDRRVPADDDDDDDDNNNNNNHDEEEDDKLPAIPFDFLINDKLLRLPLDSTVRKEGLSTERAVIVHYFPARLPPRKGGETDTLPDWITAMDYYHCAGGDSASAGSHGACTGMLVVGGADGIVRAFSSSTATTSGDGSNHQSLNKIVCSASAHAGSIQCLSVSSLIQNNDSNRNGGNGVLVATGSMDQTIVTHILRDDSLNLHAVYSGGHANSISSVALSLNGQIMASGDWDGGISLWSVPSSSSSSSSGMADDDDNYEDKPKKKRKGSNATIGNDIDVTHEVKPLTSVKAHSSNVAGLIWGHHDGNASPTTLLSGSWDHGLKVYDTARMDCVLTLNGSRVVSAMDRCSNGNVVATGSPDCIVRLWDMRTNNTGEVSSHIGGMDKSLRQSHKAWVSSVKWSPMDPFILASTSHDGTMKIWDIRSYLPLHTVNAVNKKKLGEKALCLAFGDGVIYSGGSDCVVKQFSCNV